MSRYRDYFTVDKDGFLLSVVSLLPEEVPFYTNLREERPPERPIQPPAPMQPDYRASRSELYPPLAEQLDMLWHAMNDGVLPIAEPFYSRIAAVKSAYPKDNSVQPGMAIVLNTD